MRGVRTRDFLYLRNLRPNRWPGGDPIVYHSVGDYGDVDPSRTKAHILAHRNDPAMAKFVSLILKKRPAEELYDVRNDPDQLHNIAAQPAYAAALAQHRARVDQWMKDTADPRLDPNYDEFDKYPYYGGGLAPELRAWEAEKP